MRLAVLRPSELTPEQRELHAAITAGPRGRAHVAEDGSLEGPFNAWLHHPVVGLPLQRVGAALRFEGVLPARARELAILCVAAAHAADFEWHAHARIGASLGVTADELESIRTGTPPELEDEHEREVLAVTRALLERQDLDDAEYARAVEAVGVAALVEVTTLVGYYAAVALQMRVFRVPAPDGSTPFAMEVR
jgi:4-carboxymuconolactone decarboxylase